MTDTGIALETLVALERLYGGVPGDHSYEPAPLTKWWLYDNTAALPADIGPGEWRESEDSGLWVSVVDQQGNNYLTWYFQTLVAGSVITLRPEGYPQLRFQLSAPGTYDTPSGVMVFAGSYLEGQGPDVTGVITEIVTPQPPAEEPEEPTPETDLCGWVAASSIATIQAYLEEPAHCSSADLEAVKACEEAGAQRVTLLQWLEQQLQGLEGDEMS